MSFLKKYFPAPETWHTLPPLSPAEHRRRTRILAAVYVAYSACVSLAGLEIAGKISFYATDNWKPVPCDIGTPLMQKGKALFVPKVKAAAPGSHLSAKSAAFGILERTIYARQSQLVIGHGNGEVALLTRDVSTADRTYVFDKPADGRHTYKLYWLTETVDRMSGPLLVTESPGNVIDPCGQVVITAYNGLVRAVDVA
ncbi:MAG TPA: hypothetical protein VJ836_06515 [Candidatus Saccharimonadales bacterium]|nr:hypothetical protein [Candidatus Saccharimonadales bacterium]